jgi:hypothetical protein
LTRIFLHSIFTLLLPKRKADEREKRLMSLTEVRAAIEDAGSPFGFSSPPRKHFHGGPDRRTPSQVIAELGLVEGTVICLPGGLTKTVRKIRGGEVFVVGVRQRVNVYGITLP